MAGGYQFVFNRAKPESTIGTAVMVNDEATKYSTLIEEGGAFTLQRPEDALTDGRKAAISLLRTPKDYTDDMLGLSIPVGEDEQGNHLFKDDVSACEIFSAGDIPHPVPEPATATLSLLALAGLMARRKRF